MDRLDEVIAELKRNTPDLNRIVITVSSEAKGELFKELKANPRVSQRGRWFYYDDKIYLKIITIYVPKTNVFHYTKIIEPKLIERLTTTEPDQIKPDWGAIFRWEEFKDGTKM